MPLLYVGRCVPYTFASRVPPGGPWMRPGPREAVTAPSEWGCQPRMDRPCITSCPNEMSFIQSQPPHASGKQDEWDNSFRERVAQDRGVLLMKFNSETVPEGSDTGCLWGGDGRTDRPLTRCSGDW